MDKKIDQPRGIDEIELNNIVDNSKSKVKIPGTKKVYNIGWLRHEATRKITSVILKTGKEEEDKVSSKIAAAIVLNDFWKIKFFHWILWRWFYYVKQYGDAQLLPLILEGKKKVQRGEYYSVIMLAIGMRDTIMTMTREEVNRFLQEHSLEQPITSGKNSHG